MRIPFGLLALPFVLGSTGAAQEMRAPADLSEWESRSGNSPADDVDIPVWAKMSDDDGWQPLSAWGQWGPVPAQKALWLRTVLPVRLPDHPALFVECLPERLEVYVDGRRVYRYWPDQPRDSWLRDAGI